MFDYSILRILYPIYLITTFLPVFRFHKNKYFNYLFIIAMIDPLYIIITNFTPVPKFNYLPIFILIIFIGLPARIVKQKVFIFIIILILLPRLGQFPLFELMINQIMFFYILYFLIDDLVNEIKQQGTLRIFLILLIFYLTFDALRVYIYYENIDLFISYYNFALVILIIVPILITIVGPEAKIIIMNQQSLLSLNKDSGLERISDESVDDGKFNELKMKLTSIEKKLLIEIGRGKKNKEIASILEISPRTVYFHLNKLKSKLNFDNHNQIVKFAVDNKDKISSIDPE